MAKRMPKGNSRIRSHHSTGSAEIRQVYQSPTLRLFVQPSLWDGFATLLDFTSANFPRYNFNLMPAEADRRALMADFTAIYQDFATASSQFEQMVKAFA